MSPAPPDTSRMFNSTARVNEILRGRRARSLALPDRRSLVSPIVTDDLPARSIALV
jgi:hypothetical protein